MSLILPEILWAPVPHQYVMHQKGWMGNAITFGKLNPLQQDKVNPFIKCKDPSHILFSIFIYSYLLSSFSPFTAIIPGCTLLFKQ